MPFNSSGRFERLYSWVADRNNGLKIRADRMDAEFNNFQTGLDDIVLGNAEMKGPVRGVSGSAENPAYTFADDLDSGFFRKADGTIGVSVAGVEVGSFPAAFFTGIAGHLGATDDPHDIAASTILAKLRSVDGSGSGLDADLLDGNGGYYYRNAGNLNAGTLHPSRLSGSYDISISGSAASLGGVPAGSYLRSDANDTAHSPITFNRGLNVGGNGLGDSVIQFNDDNSNTWRSLFWDDSANDWRVEDNSGSIRKLWHEGNDGAGSGLDADRLDGLQATSFLRSDANDVFTGLLTGQRNSDEQLRLGQNVNRNPYVSFYNQGARRGWLQALSDRMRLAVDATTDRYLDLLSNGTLLWGGNKVWHEGNDGAGSGLDADRLDGLQASSFLRRNADSSTTGLITTSRRANEQLHLGYESGGDRSPSIVFFDGHSTRRSRIQSLDNRIRMINEGGAELSLWGAGDARVNGSRIRHTGIAAGAIGSEVFAINLSGSTLEYGDTVQGSALRPAGESDGERRSQSLPLAGTWECRGYAPNNFNSHFVRIA